MEGDRKLPLMIIIEEYADRRCTIDIDGQFRSYSIDVDIAIPVIAAISDDHILSIVAGNKYHSTVYYR